MSTLFVVTSEAGPNRDLAIDSRCQPWWNEHAAFIDALVDSGFIALGGPLPDTGGAVLVVRASSEAEVRQHLASDPWYAHGILRLMSVARWELFIDELHC